MATYNITDMMHAYLEDALDLAKEMNINLDFSEASLKTLDEILEGYHKDIPRDKPSEDSITQMSNIWGASLGEVIIRHSHGEWTESKFGKIIAVRFPGGSETYPPSKVYKRIVNGSEDNIVFYYQVMKNNIIK